MPHLRWHGGGLMTDADIKHLLWLGLASDEIWCAIAEPGPWTLSRAEA